MAEPAQAAVVAGNGAQGQEQQGFRQMLNMVMKMGMMYMFMTWMRGGNKNQSGGGLSLPTDVVGNSQLIRPHFSPEQLFDVDMFMSKSPNSGGKLLWHESNVPLCHNNFDLQKTISLGRDDFSGVIDKNETMYLVARFALAGVEENRFWAHGRAFISSISLIQHRAPKKVDETRNLLAGAPLGDSTAEKPVSSTPDSSADVTSNPSSSSLSGTADDEDETESDPEDDLWVPFFKSNITVSMVNMFENHNAARLPPHLAAALDYSPSAETYNPIIHMNDFWLLKEHMVAINETITAIDLHLDFNTVSNMYWTFITSFEQSFEINQKSGLMGDVDEIKRVFLEGNPYFLGLTFCVSLLHTVFDMLAFKNDIGFWKSNKSMEGLSASTIIINAFCQFIIFLYLLDSETSTVVLLSSGVGVLIECWKVTRVMNVSVDTSGRMPRLKFEHRESYVDTNTKQYDDEATRYMSYALIPMVMGYFIYSLIYEKHKSWYSFVLQALVGCVYAFGFVLMCPQLYLNYKLKSVAHLPWRQMTYKFLNTIIDDLFAFVIKMPWLHRLSVFRDDVVFLIYLYQRWIYRVDKSRVNEFGFSDEQPEAAAEGAEVQPAAIAEDDQGESTALNNPVTHRKQKSKASRKPSITAEVSKDK